MGFSAPAYKKLENRDERNKEVEKAIEEITRTPPEEAVEDKERTRTRIEDLECELQSSPMDVEKTLVNQGSMLISRRLRLRLQVEGLRKDAQSQQEDGTFERQKLGE